MYNQFFPKVFKSALQNKVEKLQKIVIRRSGTHICSRLRKQKHHLLAQRQGFVSDKLLRPSGIINKTLQTWRNSTTVALAIVLLNLPIVDADLEWGPDQLKEHQLSYEPAQPQWSSFDGLVQVPLLCKVKKLGYLQDSYLSYHVNALKCSA